MTYPPGQAGSGAPRGRAGHVIVSVVVPGLFVAAVVAVLLRAGARIRRDEREFDDPARRMTWDDDAGHWLP